MFHIARRATLLALVPALLLGPTAVAESLPTWRTGASAHEATRAHRALVTDVRWARHAHFDRVVVDIHGRRPAWRVTPTGTLTYDPSGKPVPLSGRYAYYLTLSPSATYRVDGTNVYGGPQLARPRFESLRGLALVGSFEGVTSVGFTTRHPAYRVFTLTDPSRVVIDFRH